MPWGQAALRKPEGSKGCEWVGLFVRCRSLRFIAVQGGGIAQMRGDRADRGEIGAIDVGVRGWCRTAGGDWTTCRLTVIRDGA